MKKQEKIIGKFQWGEKFGFLIPKDREYYGGDFYVKKSNFGGAEDGDKVEGVEIKSSGKKPEVKIIKVFGKETQKKQEFIEGTYSQGDGNFGFIDIEQGEKGYFVYGKNRGKAEDGDRVKAQIVEFKGKKEAIVVKIFENSEPLLTGIFKDNGNFGFVITEDNGDIFIPGAKKNFAKDGDKVKVKVTKIGGKNKEGIILENCKE